MAGFRTHVHAIIVRMATKVLNNIYDLNVVLYICEYIFVCTQIPFFPHQISIVVVVMDATRNKLHHFLWGLINSIQDMNILF